MPWSTAKRMLSMTTSGWVKSTSTCAPASATLNSQSPASTIATRSRSAAASTARHTCWPMRPRAPSTPTRIGSVIAVLSHRAVEVVLAERVRPRSGTAAGRAARRPRRPRRRRSPRRLAEQLVDAHDVAVHQLALADAGHPRAGSPRGRARCRHASGPCRARSRQRSARRLAAASSSIAHQPEHLVGLARAGTRRIRRTGRSSA